MILRIDQMLNFFVKVDKIEGGCHIWTGAIRKGYGIFWLNGKLESAHRVAFMIEHDREPEGLVIHSCDKRSCVNPAHLREGTQSDNMIDHAQRGALNINHKLTPKDVEKIRHLLFLGCYTQEEIGARYGVDQPAISSINTGRNWSHV